MEKLCDEILEEIFSYLDISSLKNVIKVSNSWSSIIKSSLRIGKNFDITIKFDIEVAEVDIPIDGLKYANLFIIGHNFCLINEKQIQNFFGHLEKYKSTIRKATFKSLSSNNLFNTFLAVWLKETTHLSIINYWNDNISNAKDHQALNIFENLNKLEVKNLFFTDQVKFFQSLGWINFEKLTDLKIYGSLKVFEQVAEEFFNNLIPNEDRGRLVKIKNLKVHGVKIQSFMNFLITQIEYLNTLELELNECENLLETIKFPKSSKWKNWNELIFKNVTTNDQKLMSHILENHQDVTTLALEYKQPIDNALLTVIPNLQKIEFKFTDGMKRYFDDFNQAHSLEIRRLNNNAQLLKLIEFLNKCSFLKILKLNLISSRVELSPSVIKLLLSAIKNLEILHLEAYSHRFKITDEALDVIKTDGKNLKKFSITVDMREGEKLREQIESFNGTKIQALVMKKMIVPTRLDPDYDSSIVLPEPAV